MPDDQVNHPSHYTFGKYEVIDILEDWFSSEPLLWQVVKYLGRWDKKGDPIENLEKAEFYLKRKIAKLKAEKESTDGLPPLPAEDRAPLGNPVAG